MGWAGAALLGSPDAHAGDIITKMAMLVFEPLAMPNQSPVGKERAQVLGILNGFDHENCRAWSALRKLFGSGVRHKEWSSFAMVIAHHLNIPMPSRATRRSFPVLLLWFEENWEVVKPHISMFRFLDEDENPIDNDREARDNGIPWNPSCTST
jgi:hypothetical protein